MAPPSTPDSLTEVLRRLADRLDDLEDHLDRIEGNQAAFTIAATAPFADMPEATKKPPFEAQPPTTAKGTAKAQAPAPSTAKPAKKECPTKKGAIPSADLPLPLAQTFTTEGKANRRLVTVVVPDDTAMHIIGKGGKGLKQVHNISGARVHAYTLSTGSSDCHGFVNPCGFRVGYAGVRVWVSIRQPSAYPYPHGGLSNPRGTRPAGLEYFVTKDLKKIYYIM